MSFVTRVSTPICPHCHQGGFLDLPTDQLDRWKAGAHIQDAFPQLTPDERELLLTGIHADCWRDLFGSEDDDEGPDL